MLTGNGASLKDAARYAWDLSPVSWSEILGGRDSGSCIFLSMASTLKTIVASDLDESFVFLHEHAPKAYFGKSYSGLQCIAHFALTSKARKVCEKIAAMPDGPEALKSSLEEVLGFRPMSDAVYQHSSFIDSHPPNLSCLLSGSHQDIRGALGIEKNDHLLSRPDALLGGRWDGHEYGHPQWRLALFADLCLMAAAEDRLIDKKDLQAARTSAQASAPKKHGDTQYFKMPSVNESLASIESILEAIEIRSSLSGVSAAKNTRSPSL